MDSSTRRRSLRTWSLTMRMIVLAVGVPLFVVAAVAAVVVFAEHDVIFLGVLAVIAVLVIVQTFRALYGAGPDARALTGAEEPELIAIVQRQCALIDIAEPEVLLSGARQANSWVMHAPGRRARLYVTTPLLELLNRDELSAVVAHELTHIANRDAALMTVVSTPGRVLLHVRGGVWGLRLMAIGVVAGLGSAMLSRCRELAADAGSAVITGRPSALSSALMKVADSQGRIPQRDLRAATALNAFNLVAVRPARLRWYHELGHLTTAFATHPQMAGRVRRLASLEREQQQPRR